MKFEDLKELYLQKKEQFRADTYKHISQLLKEAKEFHKKDWSKHPTPNRDHEQSWRAFKGKNLEKLNETPRSRATRYQFLLKQTNLLTVQLFVFFSHSLLSYIFAYCIFTAKLAYSVHKKSI